ncbi:MAG TPA: nuclear transport factor 2 family protein [Candidatus Polarisedimenticolaceae bacterium]|nr:nuclear transport factor 2 family protein [Candidatus Polarisedimenticolaceae bacterium]
MSDAEVKVWVDKYVAAWRVPAAQLAEIFTEDVSYRPSPWEEPVRGLGQLGPFWDTARAGHNEAFELEREVIAVQNNTAVVRVRVDYAHDTPSKWRDLWVLEFNEAGLCRVFEEWPFAEDQFDGQEPS